MASRNPQGQLERDLEQATLDTQAAELRSERLSYPQIAERMGCSLSTAHGRVKRAIAAVPYEAVHELRRIELESLDELEQRCRTVLLTRHVKVDHGKVIEHNGVEMLDDAPVLAAVAQILRIKDMRAKLTGEYAPTKATITVITEDIVDAEIQRLEAELAESDRSEGGSPAGQALATEGAS